MATPTNQSKNTGTLTNGSLNSASVNSNGTKNTATLTNQSVSKPISTWADATFTWAEASGDWDHVIKMTQTGKNTGTLTNQSIS